MKTVAVLGLLALVMAVNWSSVVVQAQTFQYSRGWTNGKRAGLLFPWSELAEPKNGSSSAGETEPEGEGERPEG